jgi:methanogenic corrinoid protein MtbC1
MKKLVVDLITYEGYDPDDLGVEVPPNNPRELVCQLPPAKAGSLSFQVSC